MNSTRAAARAIASDPDPLSRAKRAQVLLRELDATIGELGKMRREAVIEAAGQTNNVSKLAADLGLSRERVYQMLPK